MQMRLSVNIRQSFLAKDMKGLLIFPDGYSLPSGYSSTGGTGMSEVNSSEVDFPFSNVPDGTFMKMEEAGVVFLPAVGYRNGGRRLLLFKYL